MLTLALIFMSLALQITAQCPYLAAHPTKFPPQSKGSSLLFGDFPEAQKNAADLMDSLLDKYHTSIVELDIPCPHLMNRIFAVLSPTVAQQILLDTSGTFTKGSFEQRTEKNIFPPEGLIWMPANTRWELLNAALFNGPFNPQSFPNCYAPVFKDAFIWFVQRLEHMKEPFDLYRECTYYSMRTMSHAFFHYLLEDDELMALSDAFKFMFSFMHKRETSVLALPLITPLSQHRLFYKHRTTFNRILKKIIVQAPYSVTHNGITYPTIMGILKTHRDPETNTALTEDEILSHVATLFFAGHDTTANFITMLIYHLSTTSTWYNRIQNELYKNYRDRSLEWLPLNNLLEYSCFKNEILRLFPSVPLVSINTTKQVILDGYTIPQKSTLLIALHTIQKNPDFFKNPTLFNPDRFNQNNQDYTSCTTSSMMPFNFGPRRCLGQWFAQAEAQHLITHLINHNIRFTIEPLKERLKLTVGLSGMPNQKIFAHIHVPENFDSLIETILKKSSVAADIHDLPMRIISIRYENENKTIKTYRLAPLHTIKLPFSYHPGDHLELIAKNSSDQTVIRHYSISSSPTDSDEWIEITLKKEENPHKKSISHFMHDELTEHDILFVRIPMDDGVRVSTYDDPSRPLILISGGIGITPMISVLRYCIAHDWPGQIYFIHSCKTKEDCAFYEELHMLSKRHNNIHIIVTFTQRQQTDADYTGRISQSLFDSLAISDIDNAKIYLCSKESMCSEIGSLLQKNYGVPSASLHQLSFGAIDQTDYKSQKIYTHEEVSHHNQRTDAWIIIENIVYDITNYIDKHPGLDIILDYLGKDATNAFNQTSHSAAAKKLLHHSKFITIVGRTT